MENATILSVHRRGSTLTCIFKGRGKGARAWETIVDEFVARARAAADFTDKTASFPEGARSAGQGEAIELRPSTYLLARVLWESEATTKRALENGTLVINDTTAVSELALMLTRRQHRALIKAMRDLDTPEVETDAEAGEAISVGSL